MNVLTPRRWAFVVGVSALGLLAVLAISPMVGTQPVSLASALAGQFGDQPTYEERLAASIVFNLRLPRTLLALCAGFTLALAGVSFQALLRNPLATPYTLGVASGGSLGAMLGFKLGLAAVWASEARGGMPSYFGDFAIAFAAFLGAAAVTFIVYALARSSARLSTFDLLLAGVTLSIFCAAMSLFIQYLADPREMVEMVHWTMGSVGDVRFRRIKVVLPFVVPGCAILFTLAGPLNQLALGAELANARGVRVAKLQALCFFAASLGTGAVVAWCGPIGFVGLIVPHAVRSVVGPDHRVLMPATALAGGAFLIVCDWVSRLGLVWFGSLTGRNLAGAELPIGIITAMLGGPFFLVLLVRARKREFGGARE